MELVDMIDLGSIGSNIVQVQVLPIVILNFENGFSFEFSNKNPTRRQQVARAGNKFKFKNCRISP
jgi:hypothetical protein